MPPLLNTEKLFTTKKWADVTLKLDSKEIRCHKLVLGSQSNYFAKVLDPESKFAEAGGHTIELRDDVPDAVEAMIRYIYTGQMRNLGEEHNYSWRYFFDLMKVADKYLLPDLATECFVACETKANKIDVPQEVADVLAAIRDNNQARDMTYIVDALEQRHFRCLVEVPAYFQNLTPQRLLELWHLAHNRNGLVKVWHYTCKQCSKHKFQPYKFLEYCSHSTFVEMDGIECWMRPEDKKKL